MHAVLISDLGGGGVVEISHGTVLDNTERQQAVKMKSLTLKYLTFLMATSGFNLL